MQFSEFIYKLENKFPLNTALEGDKVGLQIKTNIDNINNCFIAYELNENVIEEAIAKKSEIIICYHPLIYSPLRTIDYDERVSNLVSKLIKNDISLYVLHTCFDSYKFGTNYQLAKMFELEDLEFIEANKFYNDKGFGIIGKLNQNREISYILEKCKSIFNSPLRYNSNPKSNQIKSIAIIAGSGMSFIKNILSKQVDCFITADVKYHDFHLVNGKMLLLDPGHFEMERYIIDGIFKAMQDEDFKVDIEITKENTNPVRYFN